MSLDLALDAAFALVLDGALALVLDVALGFAFEGISFSSTFLVGAFRRAVDLETFVFGAASLFASSAFVFLALLVLVLLALAFDFVGASSSGLTFLAGALRLVRDLGLSFVSSVSSAASAALALFFAGALRRVRFLGLLSASLSS